MVGGLSKPERLVELDAMRGIAALCVVLYHFNYKYVQYNPDFGSLPVLFGWGHHGVSLFFAISGFVISMTLERMDGVVSFAKARFSRLFPVYWAAMVMTIGVVAVAGNTKLMVTPGEAVANATMLHYWFDIQSVDGSYWSLSIELSFYLVMGAVLHFRQLHRVEAILAGWLALHLLQLATGMFPTWASRMLALDYIALFAIGIIHYRLYRGQIHWKRALAWHAVLVVIAAFSGTSAAIVAAGTILVFWAMTAGILTPLAHPVLLWLGAISYPLYLIHQYVGYVLIDQLAGAGLPLLAAMATSLLVVTGLAHLLHHWVEDPVQRRMRSAKVRQLSPAE